MMTTLNVDSDDREHKGKKSPHPQPRNATFLTDLRTAMLQFTARGVFVARFADAHVPLQHSCQGETPWTPGRSLRSLHA